MTALAHRTAAAFPRHAGLVAVVLAIIAGIFGMHVLTGTHATSSPASAAAAAAPHGTGASGDPGVSAGQDSVRATAEQCSDSRACSNMQTMTAACTPSAKTSSMAAPPPGTLVRGISNNTAASADTGQWTYRPGSPSPCELSISRT